MPDGLAFGFVSTQLTLDGCSRRSSGSWSDTSTGPARRRLRLLGADGLTLIPGPSPSGRREGFRYPKRADSGLDDQKILVQMEQVDAEFIEVYNERLDRWEAERLDDWTATLTLAAQHPFPHSGGGACPCG
jgi:hypothetical protein